MGDDGVRVCACTVWGGNGSNQLQHCCYCSLPMLNVNVLLLKSLLFLTLLFNNSSTVQQCLRLNVLTTLYHAVLKH